MPWALTVFISVARVTAMQVDKNFSSKRQKMLSPARRVSVGGNGGTDASERDQTGAAAQKAR